MSDFDPKNHLMQLKGKDYLEVKWRLVWLRHDHPSAVIETELMQHSDTHAIFKATVDIPLVGGEGGGSATGWGSETKSDFNDYIEKAETKAIGRALGALGYGTQFAPDLDDGVSANRPVDAPVQRSAPPRDRSTTRNTVPDAPQATQTHATPKQAQDDGDTFERCSKGQLNIIEKHRNMLGWSEDDITALAKAKDAESVEMLSTEQATALIHFLADAPKATAYMDKKRATQMQFVPEHDAAARARQ